MLCAGPACLFLFGLSALVLHSAAPLIGGTTSLFLGGGIVVTVNAVSARSFKGGLVAIWRAAAEPSLRHITRRQRPDYARIRELEQERRAVELLRSEEEK